METGTQGRRWLSHYRRLMVCVLVGLTVTSARPQPKATAVKAAFIYNFAQFVDWPTSAFAGTNAPLVVGVLNAPSIYQAVLEITRGETVRGHPFEVRLVRTAAEAARTHVLYVPPEEAGVWPACREAVRSRPVLTVGDAAGFAREGGMIELFTRENRVRFRANPAEARKAGLMLSSKLLRLAEIVETEDD